jgi:rare lipoprotein A
MRHMRNIAILLIICTSLAAQKKTDTKLPDTTAKKQKPPKVLYGIGSYYADKFEGRQTANGQYYSHNKLTAACNQLPLNTWIRVTNLRNKKSVVVFVNDRLHPKNKRLVDLSRSAAKELGYISHGLANVKVEVLLKKQVQ